MAYDKKYPEIGDEILLFDKGQEDRVDKAFEELGGVKVTLTAINGFEFGNRSEGWNEHVAYRVGNVVYLQGLLRKGGGDANKVAFVLPSGFRPLGTTQVSLGGSSTAIATITNNGHFTPNVMGSHCHLNGAFFII